MMDKRTLKDARWSCQSCGSCCRGFSFGPVEEHIVQGLEDRDIGTHWAPAKTEWYVKHPQTGDLYFTHIDGHCVFLQEDNRCAIHARWGSKAKPWFCREYPFSIVEDEQGMSITVRDDCGGFHKSMDQGELVSEQLDDVFDIVRLVPRQRFDPKQVVILPGLGVSVANWLQVEPVLLEVCHDSAGDSVSSIRSALYRMAGRSPMDVSVEMEEVFSFLIRSLEQQISRLQVDPMMSESKDFILSIIQSSDKPNETLVLDEVEEYFVRILRTRILSKSFARLGGLPAGLGFFLLEWRLFAHRGTRSVVGEQYARWRRAIHRRPFWERVRGLSDPLQHLFLGI